MTSADAPVRRPRRLWPWSALLLALPACDGCEAPARPVATVTSAASVAEAAPSSAPAPASSQGPWARAAEGDELALARLADLHSAERLAELAAGGSQAEVALAALVYAADAQLAVDELAALASDEARGERALRVLLAIASRRPAQTEPLDPDSLRRCIDRLDALSRDPAVPRQRRALAVSVLRRYARAGYLDEARITTDLDPTG